MKSINAETLFYLVRRIANQSHCRYWLDAKGDGSYSHVAIEFFSHRPEEKLLGELESYGFKYCLPVSNCRIGGIDGHILRVEALRDFETSIETRIIEGTDAGKSTFYG